MPLLKPSEALQLILGLRQYLGACGEWLLGVWAQDAREAPEQCGEHLILEAAQALRTRPTTATCWKQLAELLLAGRS